MPLKVEYVCRLDDIIAPAVEYLSATVDLFETQHLVVPTAGVKAWLLPELAKHLGATDKQDGIVANVEVDYPGSLTKYLSPIQQGEVDPWSIDNLTFELLNIIANNPDYLDIIKRSGGPLLAARAIADRFDRYQVRRPAMIRAWEEKSPIPSPTAQDHIKGGHRVIDPLSPGDMWQYKLWRAVREKIGKPSPPSRTPVISPKTPKQLLVAGFQSLSAGQLDALNILQAEVDVRVILVHPSPAIQSKWFVPVPETRGLIPERNSSPEIPTDIDQLVWSWLRGTHELEMSLMSQGIAATPATKVPEVRSSLLGRLQHVVSTDLVVESQPFDPLDHSLIIHRCHNLGRQVEVVQDALLQAFAEIPDLQPHEVVVLCPNIETAAPYLEATFSRTIETDSGKVALPLVVADRGLRQVSEGAELLSNLIDVVQSRCSVDGVLSIAKSPIVLKNRRVDTSTVELWDNYIDRTKVRWGLNSEHRARNGLNVPNLESHTWRAGLESMLLGAIVPDGAFIFEELGVSPLDDADLADIDEIAALIQIFDSVLALSDSTAIERITTEWCDLIEIAVIELSGENCDELDVPLDQLGKLRRAAQRSQIKIPFADLAVRLSEMLGEVPGRQPLRTGAITATSLVPLRGVPFRVVCILGYDEDALPAGDGEGDDLVERQRLIGDQDSRVDIRRSLLDAMLAANDRLIVTCTGQSIKNNLKVPLATPLAEFVAFAARAGVTVDDDTKISKIEIVHRRHTSSIANFISGVVQPAVVWSHNKVARDAAKKLGIPQVLKPIDLGELLASATIDLSLLELVMVNPLDLYLNRTLDIFKWRDDSMSAPATLPLELTKKEKALLAEELLEKLSTSDSADEQNNWEHAVRRRGILPVGLFADAEISEIATLALAMHNQLSANSFNYSELDSLDLEYEVSPTIRIVGQIEGYSQVDSGCSVSVSFKDRDRKYGYEYSLSKMAVRLLVAKAAGLPISKGYILARHEKWPSADQTKSWRDRTVELAPSIDQLEAVNRVATLCNMVQIALASPCGSFNEAALESDPKAAITFENFVSNESYDGTDECMVFGQNPIYSDVFNAASPVRKFWELYPTAFSTPKIDNKNVYVIS